MTFGPMPECWAFCGWICLKNHWRLLLESQLRVSLPLPRLGEKNKRELVEKKKKRKQKVNGSKISAIWVHLSAFVLEPYITLVPKMLWVFGQSWSYQLDYEGLTSKEVKGWANRGANISTRILSEFAREAFPEGPKQKIQVLF